MFQPRPQAGRPLRTSGSPLGIALLTGVFVLGGTNWPAGLRPEPACGQSPAAPSRASAKPAAIAQWLRQLDAPQYKTRQRAQQRLEQAGWAALEPVAQLSQRGSLESSTRAINVLLVWAESQDAALRIAALEKLVQLSNRPRESGRAAKILADAREQAALASIVQHGGYWVPSRVRLLNGTISRQIILDADWKGDAKTLEKLVDIPGLTTVSLYAAPVGDEIVAHLVQLPQLQRVELFGTKLSAPALAQLKAHVAYVDIRSGALLGIKATNVNGVPTIGTVVEGSAAEKAGLAVKDTITELNGDKITDFTGLTQRIAQFQPGDSVELTIVREGKTLKKQVTFARWSIASTKLDDAAILELQRPQRLLRPQRLGFDRR